MGNRWTLTSTWLLSPLLVALTATPLIAPGRASADPSLRTQMDLRGNFVLLGATLAQECGPDVPAPTTGTIGDCPNNNAAAPDVYWRADDPSDGNARADANITATDSRATAVLEIPNGARIVHARLYWGGLTGSSTPDPEVNLQRPEDNIDEVVSSDDGFVLPQPLATDRFFYQSTADVTELVNMLGPGPMRLAGVASDLSGGSGLGIFETGAVAAWYMVVFYELDGDPSRNLAIFDGLDFVDGSNPASAQLSGFAVPAVGFDAALGVVAFEGEDQFTGDALSFNGTALTNALNPSDNFFNATRSTFGSAVSIEGDLPRLTGAARSYSNVDLDVIDVTDLVSGGDTSATIEATSSLDIFLLSAFVTSISTLLPDLSSTTKAVTDVNGGVPAPGDVLEYNFVVTNEGSDPASASVLRDVLPTGVTFVPGSIEIVSGANMGEQTDAAGDDQAEYDDATRTVTVRLGTDADATGGGTIAVGDSTEVRFQVTVDEDTLGEVENQGLVTAEGESGAPEFETNTDGDVDDPGQTPTTIFIEECENDDHCEDPTPFCDTSRSPRECVGCAMSSHCTDPNLPDCNTETGQCECAMGPGNCVDTDEDGSSDGAETELGTDPNDADTDDDGVLDGDEIGAGDDTDGDGVINALDPDSDNDALPDGLERGLGCDHPDTDNSLGICRPDADMGATVTDPLLRDTDGGSVTDGSEDFDRDGEVDTGETDPTLGNGADDVGVPDTDGDGLSDPLEEMIHSDPMDPDTDDDGVSDGGEADPTIDGDRDGLISVLDPDSDNDALFDGTESGLGCGSPATDRSRGRCIPDGDSGATKTSPVDRDSDDGGVRDGSEDTNRNGVVDAGEKDPTQGNGDDDSDIEDSDGDGLSDPLENDLGTDPNDADSDDDGSPDGDEANPSDDHDGDGMLNPLDPDSDDDGLFDGTEQGRDCGGRGTDVSAGVCRADSDDGTTVTSPVNSDTDFGGKPDGAEDDNGDGVLMGMDETDPLDPADDGDCVVDSDCGDETSGMICEDYMCVPGCRGEMGNGCKEGEECSSTDETAGVCTPIPDPPTPIFGGGGCDCGVVRPARTGSGPGPLALGLLLALAVTRMRRGR